MARSGELHLWRAVLLVGLRGADADAWVGTTDFRQVASLAGLEPDAVRNSWAAGLVAPVCKARRDRPAR